MLYSSEEATTYEMGSIEQHRPLQNKTNRTNRQARLSKIARKH